MKNILLCLLFQWWEFPREECKILACAFFLILTEKLVTMWAYQKEILGKEWSKYILLIKKLLFFPNENTFFQNSVLKCSSVI